MSGPLNALTSDQAAALVVVGACSTVVCGLALYGVWWGIRRVWRWRRFYRSHHGHS